MREPTSSFKNVTATAVAAPRGHGASSTGPPLHARLEPRLTGALPARLPLLPLAAPDETAALACPLPPRVRDGAPLPGSHVRLPVTEALHPVPQAQVACGRRPCANAARPTTLQNATTGISELSFDWKNLRQHNLYFNYFFKIAVLES